jgi:hypothetical protein
MPVGAPNNDRRGIDRPGDNLFGSSIVAVNAATGKYIWHFQVTHHDIWDMDTQSPPTLVDVRRGRRTIAAVVTVNKNSQMFVLDRVTGKPVFGVEERPVPRSDVPGEQVSPTQPFPVLPEPLAQTSLRRDNLYKGGASHQSYCERLVDADELAVGHADAELQRHVQRDERADGDIVADDDELKELQQHSVWECGADRLVVLVANIDADAELQRHVQRDERADGVVVANVYQLGHIERDERGDGVGVPDVYELGHVERDERADGVLVADDDEQQELQRQRVGDCCDDGLVLVFSDVDADADL